MKRLFTLLLVAALIPGQIARAADMDSDAAPKQYTIQPGDVLEISVWKEENLLKQVLVRPDGGMSFPLVGNVQAAGKSVVELQSLIEQKLSKYIPDPVVTVSTQQLSGNKIYVIGKVARPAKCSPTTIWMSYRPSVLPAA